MNEAETRAELIEPKLAAVGWISNKETSVQIWREFHINDGEILPSGKRGRSFIADYVLEYRNIKLAVIEAKSDEKDVSEGVAQAKEYAQKLHIQTSFATNGKTIYEINHATGTESEIDTFPSPEELWQRVAGGGNEWLEKFNNVQDFKSTRQPRYYQEIAVNNVVQAIAEEKQRILLTLATGTGKTFIAFQIAWKLFQSRWTLQRDGKRQPRILFLTHRNILANQAYLDFSAFDDAALVRIKPHEIAKRGEVPKNGSVFFTIFQTFMSGKNGVPYFKKYDSKFFDLIIIDECHVGGANDESQWRDILNHFSPAVHIGLTATPKNEDNVNTYAYFGEPVFTYSLKEGIKDGFLTPFKVKRIQSTIDDYVYAPDDEVLEGEVEEGRVYEEKDFNKIIVIEERERKRVEEMLTNINPNEKTIVFCANQAHAALICNFINQAVKNSRTDYCVRVTAEDKAIGETHLRRFQDNQKSIPTILTTSRKLSTGVDAPNVRNIVLMRPIKSMIEFKQIIGRGTRLFEDKHYFTIIDFVNAYHKFNDADWDGKPVELENPESSDGEDKSASSDEPKENPPKSDTAKIPPKPKLKIRLPDGKSREIQTMTSTHFYVEGKTIGVEDYLKRLFNTLKLPEILENEARLRDIWADPRTRNELLKKLDAAGCHKADLERLQELIEAQDSDLFDVLEYIANATPPISRAARVKTSENNIYNLLSPAQREFVQYVLGNYVKEGVDELDVGKLSTLLEAKYGSLPDAQQKLGTIKEIRKTFIDFQQKLYA